MTVKQLKEELDKFDDDVEVFVYVEEGQQDIPIEEVRDINSHYFPDYKKYPKNQVTIISESVDWS